MSLTPVLVDVQRPRRQGDAAGGKTIVWNTVLTGLEATQNYYGKSSQLIHAEQATHNAQGPGLMIEKRQLFIFRQQPPPDIQIQDRIVGPDGKRFVVQFARLYTSTFQVDTELVG